MTTKNKTNNRPKAATNAFDTQVAAVQTNILTYFEPTQPLPLGPTPETAQAFQADLAAYQKVCDAATAAETAYNNAKAAKKAAAVPIRAKLKSFHLVAQAAYDPNPEVLVKLGFKAPKVRAKPDSTTKITHLQRLQARAAARKTAQTALDATLATIDAGTQAGGGTEPSASASSAAPASTEGPTEGSPARSEPEHEWDHPGRLERQHSGQVVLPPARARPNGPRDRRSFGLPGPFNPDRRWGAVFF